MAASTNGTSAHGSERQVLVSIEDLRVSFSTPFGEVCAVNGVTLQIPRRTTLAVVGESGSGKTVMARTLMGLLSKPRPRVQGSILFDGMDVLKMSERDLRDLRGARVAMVFQDPMRSLNPTMRIGDQVAEGLRHRLGMSRRAAAKRTLELLDAVRLPDAKRRSNDYPHQLSGGMRQRVVIAIALAGVPELLIADEPTTALDVTIQQQILDLLDELQDEFGMSIMLVTHDLGVAAAHSDHVAVMYAGRVVEEAPTERIFNATRMPYTRGLLDSMPRLTVRSHSKLQAIGGQPPSPTALPTGCSFQPRCPGAQDRCRHDRPVLEEDHLHHRWACWFPLETRHD